MGGASIIANRDEAEFWIGNHSAHHPTQGVITMSQTYCPTLLEHSWRVPPPPSRERDFLHPNVEKYLHNTKWGDPQEGLT
jgi:hypothetical protein